MKCIALLFAVSMLNITCFSQNRIIDSLKQNLSRQESDTDKVLTMYNLSYYYQNYKPDSAMLLAQQAYHLSEKKHFLRGQSLALGSIANAFHLLHNYPKAIEYCINRLKIEEKRGIPENIGNVYLDMANVYNSEHDVERAFFYALKAKQIAQDYHLLELSSYVDLNIGDMYEKSNQLDSATIYTQKAYQLSTSQQNELLIGTALNNLGNINIKKKNYLIAYNYYQQCIPYLIRNEDYNTLAECKLGIAKIHQENGRIDSAIYYAKQVYTSSLHNELPTRSLEACTLLSKLYKGEHNIDSAFAYQEIMVDLTNSIDNKDRVKELQSLTFSEELRQEEIAEEHKKELEERKEKLQLLAIGIFIPIFFLISIFLSQRKVSHKVIEFSGIISLLLLFEYITLLIHPFISEKSHHSPFIEIVIFVVIASLLTPAHHRFEVWLIKKLSKLHERHQQKSKQP